MITFVLPGYSSKNRDWVLETAKKLDLKHEIRPVLWEHWDEPEKRFSAEGKAEELTQVLLKDNANIVAKSIGTLVASLVIAKIPDRVHKVILCGLPYNDLLDNDLSNMRNAIVSFPPKNIVCFQNENDPHGSFSDVRRFMSEINPEIAVIPKVGTTHDYPYFEDFQSFLKP